MCRGRFTFCRVAMQKRKFSFPYQVRYQSHRSRASVNLFYELTGETVTSSEEPLYSPFKPAFGNNNMNSGRHDSLPGSMELIYKRYELGAIHT
jgi:hypothetical protein